MDFDSDSVNFCKSKNLKVSTLPLEHEKIIL